MLSIKERHVSTLRSYGERLRKKYGNKLTSKKNTFVHTRSSRLCKLWQCTNERKYVDRCFELNFSYMLRLLKNTKYRNGWSVEEAISEYYLKLDNIMSRFDDSNRTIFFCKYLEMRMRGHLSNIRKQRREHLFVRLEDWHATLAQ